MPLLERILTTVRRHDLMPPGARVLAAVSGGADSVALALALARLASDGALDCTLAGIAHLHHGLRGADADGDAAFVEALASRLGVPFVAGRADVAARAKEAGESIEAAARRARYAFLEQTAVAFGATCVATGHTADDQAETLVLRLMRGAGLHGLSGIRPHNGNVIRPLLEASRAEVETFLTSAGETWRDDATNADLRIARNRVRHELMPVLRAIGGPAAAASLARTAALIQDDAGELDRQAIETATRAVLPGEPAGVGLSLAIDALDAAGPALARRVIRTALGQMAPDRFQALEHVEAVRSLIKREGEAFPSRVQVPGVVARRAGTVIRLEPEAVPAAAPFEAPLQVPGQVTVPEAGVIVSAELGTCGADAMSRLSARGDRVAVQGLGGNRLTVRNRRPGDAFRPLGAPGRRKLQDLFVDRKLARSERDRVPLVVDEDGRIVWVVGHAIADEFRVTAPGGRVLLLKVQRTGFLETPF